MSRIALALLVIATGCGGPEPGRGGASCTHVRSERQAGGRAFCEDVWTCERPPAGVFDRVGLRRIARCEGASGPVVLYLPGMHMNAALPGVDARADLRLYLADHGFRAWGIDYRTHAVPPDAPPADLAALGRWTTETFVDDVAWAIAFVRGGDAGPLFLAGFSWGGGLAYRLASRGEAVAGLVVLDAMAGGGGPGEGPAAIDVGSSRLPYPTRQALVTRAARAPDAASPLAGYPTAGEALADVLFTARSFGSRGGLSNAKGGTSSVQAVAALLATYDRWWPRGALGAPAPAPRDVPVIAFVAGQMDAGWVERVRASARAFGGEAAEVHVLPGHGHLDVLVGRQAPQLVFEPARAWIATRAGVTAR